MSPVSLLDALNHSTDTYKDELSVITINNDIDGDSHILVCVCVSKDEKVKH